MGDTGVVLFDTTSSAMRADAVLRREGLPVRLIPTPRELSSDCGVALRFSWSDHDRIETMLREAAVVIAGVHQLPAR